MSLQASEHRARVQHTNFTQVGTLAQNSNGKLSDWSNASGYESSGVSAQTALNNIRQERVRLEHNCQTQAMVGAIGTILMVAAMSMFFDLPAPAQYVRIIAAGVVLALFWMVMRPVRGLPTFLLGAHLIMSLTILGDQGWMQASSAEAWDMLLLLVGVVAAALCWAREYKSALLRVSEVNLRLNTYSENVGKRGWNGSIR